MAEAKRAGIARRQQECSPETALQLYIGVIQDPIRPQNITQFFVFFVVSKKRTTNFVIVLSLLVLPSSSANLF
jgi:hypothetical protein